MNDARKLDLFSEYGCRASAIPAQRPYCGSLQKRADRNLRPGFGLPRRIELYRPGIYQIADHQPSVGANVAPLHRRRTQRQGNHAMRRGQQRRRQPLRQRRRRFRALLGKEFLDRRDKNLLAAPRNLGLAEIHAIGETPVLDRPRHRIERAEVIGISTQ